MNNTLLIFAAVTFVSVATPGPDVLLALANGSRFGVKTSLLGMLGVLLADLILILAVALGLGALLAASEFWFSFFKWVGVAYIAYLGVRMLRSSAGLAVDHSRSDERPSGRSVFARSFIVAVTNPKGYLFFSAVLPQFIALSQPQFSQYVALTGTFVVVESTIMLAYAAAGAQAIRAIGARGVRWLERICGAAMLALATSLALYRRSA